MRSRSFFVIIVLAASLAVTLAIGLFTASAIDEPAAQDPYRQREAAFRENNLGVAYLEQFEPAKASESFRKAVATDPSVKIAHINLAISLFYQQEIEAARVAADKAVAIAPEYLHSQYLSGLIARNENRVDDALAAFQKVLAADPTDVGSNVNVGQIYLQQRKYEDAIASFRKAYHKEPYNSTAIYNLATALIRTERRDEGQKLIDRFQELRQSGAGTSLGQNYLEQGRYAEALVSTGSEPELVDRVGTPLRFSAITLGLRASSPALTFIDIENDGDPDVIAVSANGAKTIYRNDRGKFAALPAGRGGINRPSRLKVAGILSGDINNDTFEDLVFFGEGRPEYFKGDGKGGFRDLSSALPPTSGRFTTGALADVDHDGDLDLILFGQQAGRRVAGIAKLIRNNGNGTFTDVTAESKLAPVSRPVAVIPTDFDNRRDMDLLVLGSGERPRLYQNLRDGSFRDAAAEVGLDRIEKWTAAAAGDFNKDGYIDFFFGRENGPGLFATSDGRGAFILSDAPPETAGSESAQFADLDNDGLLDLTIGNATGAVLLRNLGDRWTEFSSAFGNSAAPGGKLTIADVDRDGSLDLIAVPRNGTPAFFRNETSGSNRSVSVSLKGRVSNRTGVGAKVDVRAGSLTQKLESYSASPMPAAWDIHFGLGRRDTADTVRVIWPSGVIQAEVTTATESVAERHRALSLEELDRKPSSCPYLYTWDGEKFAFVTDFLGGGEMGNWKDHGVYHFPDSDEYVRITDDQLKARDGKYELRITNELEEVLFLDQIKLLAIDHPTGTEVYPNEGLGIPTAGKTILYSTAADHPPVRAVDSKGRDILPKISVLDRTFYDSFDSTGIRGYAEPHSLTMTLDRRNGYRGRTLLLLTGWTDYAFSSDNLAASQSGQRLFFPRLQVRNARGEWQTVVDSIGISVGRPQTVVVDLTDKFLSDSRDVRIVTNVKTYWDKISVDTSSQIDLEPRELPVLEADLGRRGFSEEIFYSGMVVPTYSAAADDGRWKYFTGRFTRLGDVLPLVRKIDDVFVISRTGDELTLSFEALQQPKAGWKRTFLLYADGYSKEMDINSGSPDAVWPLPFKGMSTYPYSLPERFPMTEEKQRIYDEYTTRIEGRRMPGLPLASLLR